MSVFYGNKYIYIVNNNNENLCILLVECGQQTVTSIG